MKFVTLTVDEYNEFTMKNFSHYTQSKLHYINSNDNSTHIVGVKNGFEDKILAACLLTEGRCLKYFKYFYSQRGPVMNYNDYSIVEYFYTNLIEYLKKQKCVYFISDPYLIENIRDCRGNVIESKNNNTFNRILKKLKFKHLGYSVGYSTTSQIRWLSVLDLKNKTEDKLLKDMQYQTRRNIKKTYEMGVKVKTLNYEETERFFKLFRMAEEKHGFKFRDLNYFKRLQNTYGDNIKLKLAYIDLNELKIKYEKRLENLQANLRDVQATLSQNKNSKKTKTKHQQIVQQINSQKNKLNETINLIKTDGYILDLAAAVYIFNNHEVYYLSSGSNPKYNSYMGAYRLQWEMIKFAKENNIDRYNFYGITGDFSEEAEDYGVQRFKEGFNAHVEEYIGDYIRIIKPLPYLLYKIKTFVR
ncbi:aminoacyltransferase [Staphylococcus agnetis]|uniref:Aminoacyltransferase FemA n=1 Tax=Staphylococcus agnetis TaxID=985762 RepID=A0ABX3Z227_9STAP|nr:aminoacyltransferase [Staphylococcus agnetis]MDG4943918.1 aminoacyltransferase [Staphylococcus agnetis]OSP22572.1 methicillin resistance protein [Staphylococcus agnetis]OSP23137.1 methicillin resistance protein [Staphylococcus agnetis]OTW30534.1 methicillin resistance protein [Staphylococcus agnetis]